MAKCNNCKRDREKKKYPPREMVRLPVEVTNHETFQRKALPIFLCGACDKLSLAAACRTHERRVKK